MSTRRDHWPPRPPAGRFPRRIVLALAPLHAQFLSAMTTSVMRTVRACLRNPAAAAVILQFALATIAHGATAPGAITFVGTDSNIYYCDAKCPEPKCVTCKAAAIHVRRDDAIVPVADSAPDAGPAIATEYGLPTFSPDGKRLAYSSETHSQSGDSFVVWVYDLARSQPMQIFESRAERILYLAWLPDAQHLSFLLAEPRGLSLVLAELKESTPVRIVATGMPLYFDWGARPGELVLHMLALDSDRTEQVSLMSLTPTSQNVVKLLSRGRTPFKTPAWSPDGRRLAYIANNHAESNLVVADADAAHPRSVVSLPVGDNSFVWAPDSAHLAYSTAIMARNPIYHGIKLVDVASANSRWLTHNDVAAFFFAPDSRHLAYIGVPEDKPYYTWSVVDLKTGAEKTLGNFLATSEESVAYRYFDQLAVSHTIWSPDSSSFIYAGVRLVGSPGQSLGFAPPPAAYIVPIDGSEPRRISTAVLAFFSPAK
jgi:Tol biopolymer transport system component